MNIVSAEALAELLTNSGKEVVFLCGSFISTTHPAFLASAWDVKCTSIPFLAPPDADANEIQEITNRSLPESYYALASDTLGDGVLDLWKVMDYQPGDPRIVSSLYGPTQMHMAVVQIAHRLNTPIITPNYDRLFELAMEAQKIKPVVWRPQDFAGQNVGRGFGLWKVHGSVESQVYTLLAQITRANYPMLAQLKAAVHNRVIVMVGYSGRDIDVFPYLMSWKDGPSEIWWLDPFIQSTDHLAPICSDLVEMSFYGVPASSDELIVELERKLAQHHLPPLPLVGASMPGENAKTELPRHQKIILDSLTSSALDNSKRRLLHLRALANVGLNSAAYAFLDRLSIDQFSEDRDRFRYLIVKAQVEHELCLFVDSQRTAEKAQSVAKKLGTNERIVESSVTRAEALRMQITARYPVGPTYTSIKDLVRLGTLFIWTSVWSRFRLRSISPDASTYAGQLAIFAWIEHDIRLGALLQGLSEKLRLPKRIRHFFLRRFWKSVDQRSRKWGYAAGVANSSKYSTRVGAKSELMLIQPRLVYSLLSDATGMAIARRDDADQALESGLLEVARSLYLEAAWLAWEISDPSLEAKAYVGLAKAGGEVPIDRQQLRGLVQSIQGRIHERLVNPIEEYVYKSHVP